MAPADFKGLRFRTVGLAATVMVRMGAASNPLRARSRPAMSVDWIDAAEFNNVSSDRALGTGRSGQGLHAAELPPGVRTIRDPIQPEQIAAAAGGFESDDRCRRAGEQRRYVMEGDRRYSRDYAELRSQEQGGVSQDAAIDPRAQLELVDRVVARKSGRKSMVQAVLDSMREFAARAGVAGIRHHGRQRSGVQPVLAAATTPAKRNAKDTPAFRSRICNASVRCAPSFPAGRRPSPLRSGEQQPDRSFDLQ